jgi:hypothetical protein
MNLEIENSHPVEEKIFFTLVCLIWSYQTLFRYVCIALSRLPYLNSFFLIYFRPIVIIFFIIASFPFILRKLNYRDLMFSIIILLLVCVTIFINSKYDQKFINDYLWTFLLQAFPLYFIGRSVVFELKNDNRIIILGRLSLLCLVFAIFVVLLYGANIQAEWSDNMYYSYIILPHILLVLFLAVNYKKLLYIVSFIVGFLFLLMLGNRGSLVCVSIFALVTMYKTISNLSATKKIAVIVVLIAATLFFVQGELYRSLLTNLYSFSSRHGLSARLLYYLNGQINEPFDSGRGAIRKKIIDAINNNPFGYGLSSDVYFAGQYAHNIFIEMWVEFGVVFGTFFLGLFLFSFVKVLANSNITWKQKNIFWIFICLSLVKLCISGTYITDPYFFFTIGLAISLGKVKEQNAS